MENKDTIVDKVKDKLEDLAEHLTPETEAPDNFPSYTPKAFYTRKQIPKAKRKKLRKIAKKSRLFNRRRAKGK